MSNGTRLAVSVVGANGRMGSIVCIRLQKKPNRLRIYGVVNQNEDRVPGAIRNGKFKVTKDIKSALQDSKVVLFALHPKNLQKCLIENKGFLEGKIVLSSDAHYSIRQLERMSGAASGKFVPSPAIMTPFSAIPACYTTNMTNRQIKLASRVLSSLGDVIQVSEGDLPGCFAHCMDIALNNSRIIGLKNNDGLNETLSNCIAIKHLKAAAYLSEHYTWGEPIEYTCTPGGSTEKVIKRLDFDWQGEIVMEAIRKKKR